MSDSEQSDSQSDFNHLNKLNPDDSQSESQPQPLKVPQKSPAILQNPPEKTQSRTQTKTNSVNMPQPSLQVPKTEMPAPKKQLLLAKQNKPRLIIDHLILKNFKSYAGTQKIGPFHKNFTSIVGPNGSGKSNLIQSMLFIFGFNASWMRLNKLHQLIHNSSEMGDVGSAAVEVHFKKILDNPDGTVTEFPDSKFYIRRTVNTSSVSKYYINGNDSTQAEVKTKLKSEGIDLTNNRFLILQGEVEQISQMKQKSGDRDKPGFLEYLEDIIGSNQFIDKIEEAVKEYNANEETKHEKGERMKIVENELKGMSSQKEEAIKYVKRERKIYQVESILQQVLRSNSAFAMKKVQQKHDHLEARKNQIVKEEKQKLAKQQDRIKEIRRLKEEGDMIEKQITRDNNKMNELDIEDNNIKSQISYNSQDQAKYEKTIEQIDAQFTKIVEESDAIKKNLPEKQQKLKEKKERVDELKQEVSKYDHPELRAKIKNIENELNKAKHLRGTFQDKHETLKQEVSKHSDVGSEGKMGEFKQEIRKNLQMKTKIEMAVQKAVEEHKRVRNNLNEEINDRNKMRQQVSMIEGMIKEQNQQRQNEGNSDKLLNEIMRANIPGVIGRLGDLGDVPKEYEEVLSTAAGLRLNNIVVRNESAAEQVLKMLKTNNLGVATCIILQRIADQRNYMNKPFNPPKDTIRLFDLIKPANDEAQLVFYFALRDTLYCQNMNYALKLSMGDNNIRRRVIAPNKKEYAIYQMNGSMSSVRPSRGLFQKKARPKKNQLDNRENQQKLQSLHAQIQEKDRLVKQSENKLKEIEENIRSMKAQASLFQNKIRQFADQLKDIQRTAQRNRGKKVNLENMQTQMRALQKQIEKLNQQINHLQTELTKLQNQQKKHETPKITSMREEYKQLRQQCAALEKQVEKQEVMITTVDKRIKQNQKKKKETQQRIQKLQQMIEKCKNDMQTIEKIGMEVLNRIEANKKKKQEFLKQYNAIREQLNKDDEAVRESRNKIQDAKAQVQNAKRQLHKLYEDVKFATSELERIRKLYKEMTSTYDFFEELDDIEKMNLDQSFNQSTSILDITMHHMSMEQGTDQKQNASSTNKKKENDRNLDIKKIEKTDPYKDLTEDELDEFLLFEAKLRAVLGTQGAELKKMQGKNLAVISEYRSKFIDYKQKLKEFNEVKEKQSNLKKLINDLKEQRFQMFREGFSIINSKLKEVYQLLTNGGDAEMELIDSLDPFSDGVNFSVRPPKKAWKEINKLSGGQKTLSSLSLIFALHYYKPTPLYFMDEIDAALDFKNVSIVGDYIKKRTKDAQFIIISLRNNMFDLADKLVGVYKTFDMTKTLNLAASKLNAKRMQQNNEQEKKEKENLSINLPQLEM